MKASASWDTRRRKELVTNNEAVFHLLCCNITSPFLHSPLTAIILGGR